MNEYSYEGPVEKFGVCVCHNWKAKTMAPSKRKAISNLKYRYKLENCLVPTTKISLPGKVTVI